MGIVCRLGEFRPDEENRYEGLLRRAALASAVLVAAGALFLAFSFIGADRKKTVAMEKIPTRSAPVPSAPKAFVSSNWGTFPEGPEPPDREPGVQDLSAPEWSRREAFKDLKAMAVFEIRGAAPRGDEAERCAELLRKGGGS